MMNFRFKVNNFPAAAKSLSGEKLLKVVQAGGFVVEAEAKINVNQTFSSKSKGGAGLAGSIQTTVEEASEHRAQVNVGPSVIYGRIQELGGVVLPVFARMLSWVDNGQRIFAKRVQIPARPYMRPAMDEHRDDIINAMAYQAKKQLDNDLP